MRNRNIIFWSLVYIEKSTRRNSISLPYSIVSVAMNRRRSEIGKVVKSPRALLVPLQRFVPSLHSSSIVLTQCDYSQQPKIRLRAPAQLDDDSLTLGTFTWYIHHHLLHHNILTTNASTRPSSPSPRKSTNDISLDFSIDTTESTPIPFTVSELSSTRSLYTFAELLAQKIYREKKLGKQKAVVKNQVWSKTQKGGGSVAHYGKRAGNAVLLPPPGAAAKRKGKKQDLRNDSASEVVMEEAGKMKGKQIAPLMNEELEKAVGRVFVDAMRLMRKTGTIILTSTVDSTLEKLELDTSSTSMTRDTSTWGLGSTSTSTSLGTKPKGYCELDISVSGSTTGSSGAQDTSRWVGSTNSFALPDESKKKSAARWESDMILDQEIKRPIQKSSSGFYELDTTGLDAIKSENYTSDKKPAYWELDLETTPRAITRSVAHVLSPLTASTQLFLPPPVKKSVPFLLPSSPNTTAISDTTMGTNDTWTTSMQEIDNESFELVTTTSLAPYLLRILKNESDRSNLVPSKKSTNHPSLTVKAKKGKGGVIAGPIGCEEVVVRKRLANDTRWEAVAKTDLVVSALEELRRRNLIRYAGKLWKYGSF